MANAGDRDAGTWLATFASALGAGDAAAVADLFLEHGAWRDVVAFGWTIGTHEGRGAIAAFVERLDGSSLSDVTMEAAVGQAEGFFSFRNRNGVVRGYLRLVEGRCLTLLTALEDLADHPERTGANRISGVVDDPSGRNWLDLREAAKVALGVEEQPYILIVGGGQSGLALGARLKALDVPTLIIDRQERVGAQWRSRYKSLTLHDPVWYDHLPYMPFPDNWPVYTPKDKMGDWLELYADAMELDVWTGTELTSASYDAESCQWTAEVVRGGEALTLRPTHLVMALGNAGFPSVPHIHGAERFQGMQCHSSEHRGGSALVGKKVAIIGANNSAHDIAADLVQCGAHPTMVQRSSTLIVRQQTLFDLVTSLLYSHGAVQAGITTDRADLIAISAPMRLMEHVQRSVWEVIQERDKEFYDALRAVGFKLDFAEDGAGMVLKYMRSASGYYIDVGASQMVIDGRIALKSQVEIDAIDEAGLQFADGTRLDVDAIIYATGFGSMEQWISRLISPDVASKVGHCWGYGSGFKGDPGPYEGEIRNMWKPTSQEGLWFMGGNLQQCRIFSKYLAQQLKARFEGLDTSIVEPKRA